MGQAAGGDLSVVVAMSDGRDLSSAARVLITIELRLFNETQREEGDDDEKRDLRPGIDRRSN
jgi:hypothetical protein